MCGNHSAISRWTVTRRGSPPRVREPLRKLPLGGRYRGITPACAGTTRSRCPRFQAPWDHPRVCGNHYTQCGRGRGPSGSPPRVREPHHVMEVIHALRRITPACAGTTSRCSSRYSAPWDHPRVCGNHIYDTAASSGS